jgi:hypothetical protein
MGLAGSDPWPRSGWIRLFVPGMDIFHLNQQQLGHTVGHMAPPPSVGHPNLADLDHVVGNTHEVYPQHHSCLKCTSRDRRGSWWSWARRVWCPALSAIPSEPSGVCTISWSFYAWQQTESWKGLNRGSNFPTQQEITAGGRRTWRDGACSSFANKLTRIHNAELHVAHANHEATELSLARSTEN